MRVVSDGVTYHAGCAACNWIGPTAYDDPNRAMIGARAHYRLKHPTAVDNIPLPGLEDFGFGKITFIGDNKQLQIGDN